MALPKISNINLNQSENMTARPNLYGDNLNLMKFDEGSNPKQ